MKVSGFTFLRNGVQLGYPFMESILSALPLCDEFVIAVGKCEDDTLARLHSIRDPKVRIIETRWNEKMVDRGFVYAQQKMIAHYNCCGDWAFYLEGDEVLHEKDIPAIRSAMERHYPNPRVEALVFKYHHFYGTPSWLATSPGWYRYAPRIIRNNLRVYSPDGLFFVVMDKNKRGRYPFAASTDVHIYHYGHVRRRAYMQEKVNQVSRYWGHTPDFQAYQIDPEALNVFAGTHPAVMKEWLAKEAEWDFIPDKDHAPTRKELKHRLMMTFERWFNLELSKKHYKLVK